MGHVNVMVLFLFPCLSAEAFAQNEMFLTKYREHIEDFIMKGHVRGWKHCDVIHDISQPQQSSLSDASPMFVVEIHKLPTYDIKTTYSLSNCLLISAHIKSNESLAEIIKFGWSVVQHKRLALFLVMSNGLTLDMANNTTKLPFVIAARLEGISDQFLCPIIGQANPSLQDMKCDLKYTSLENKTLRTGIYGLVPNFGELNNCYRTKISL